MQVETVHNTAFVLCRQTELYFNYVPLSAFVPAQRYKFSHRIKNELLYFTLTFVPI